MAAGKKDEGFKYDPNPLFAVELVDMGNGTRAVSHAPAFDPMYGPESEQQIEWHKKKGTPGADKWQVGEPVRLGRAPRAAAA